MLLTQIDGRVFNIVRALCALVTVKHYKHARTTVIAKTL